MHEFSWLVTVWQIVSSTHVGGCIHADLRHRTCFVHFLFFCNLQRFHTVGMGLIARVGGLIITTLDIISCQIHHVVSIWIGDWVLFQVVLVMSIHLCHSIDKLDVPQSVWLVVYTLHRVSPIVHLSAAGLLGIHFLGGNQLHKSIDSHRTAHVLYLAHWARYCVGRFDAEVTAEFLRAQRTVIPVWHALLLIPSLVFLLNTSI